MDRMMKAAYFMGNGRFETVEEPVPEYGPKDVLVRVAACGVCGTDVHIYHGDKGSAEVRPPVVLGHELAGVVEAAGAEVTGLRVGDPVAVDPNHYCGKCHYCRIGKKQLCERLYAVGVNRNGGFAEYCAVPEEQCYPLPKEMPLRYGAMAEPLACCLHGIDRAGIRAGDTVLVVGGGAIGLMMLQLAKLRGVSAAGLSDPVAMRREIAKELGADFTVDPVKESLPEALEKHLGVAGADVIIECAGNTTAVRQAFEATKRGSTVLLFSVPKPDTAHPLDLMDVYRKELTVIGSMINPDTHGRAVALIASGRIRLEKIITHSYPVEKTEEAIRMQMSDESIKVLIEPGQENTRKK